MPPALRRSLLPAAALWALGAAAAVGAAGCAIGSQRFGRVIDARQIPQVKVGKSTKQDVLDLFGPPTNFQRYAGTGDMTLKTTDQDWQARFPIETAKAAEDVFTYEYREENESFFTAILFTYFSRDTIADTLMVFFDAKDLVKYLAFAKQTEAEVEPDEPDE